MNETPLNDTRLTDTRLTDTPLTDTRLTGTPLAEDTAMTEDTMAGDLIPVTDDELNALHRRLALAAERDGLLDVAYRTIDSPVGALLLAATERGLVRVGFAVEGHDTVLTELADRVSPRVLAAPGRLDDVAREVEEYFAGRRTRFDLPLDDRLATGFRREVIRYLPEIGYGRTASYAQVAAAAGSPRAVRAVGSACARNPLPIVLPCHRVVRSDGRPGDYRGGPDAKLTLLALESEAR